ncbi:hypothetical protein [Microbacterium sp. 1.5R]|uniref:hypothetical protein n=1 Tax=Microbacterium sp. 1.5R TaxID=1916917 RepID=UPI0011A1EE97|nr:hypothetical protein [Microbacterium sp. 1.5R]
MKAEAEIRRREAPLVPGAHRVVRRLTADEGPYPGVLVTRGDAVAVLRNLDELREWEGLRHAGAGHVAGPVDLVRRIDGHEVLLPWCTERLSTFIGQRGSGEPALSGGEVSTLVVSLLRGIDELAASSGADAVGEWWLTDEGCPVFVIGAGSDARSSAADLIRALERERSDRVQRRLLAAISDGLRQALDRPDVPRRQLLAWESELLEIATPRPLMRIDELAPETQEADVLHRVRASLTTASPPSVPRGDARAPAGRRHASTGRRRASEGRRASSRRRKVLSWGWGLGAAVEVLAPLSEGARRLSGRITRRRGATPSREGQGAAHTDTAPGGRSRRRTPKILVGAGAAGLVLLTGALWPGEAAEPPSSGRDKVSGIDEEAGSAGMDADVGRSPAPMESADDTRADEVPGMQSDDDPAAVVATLLREIEECHRAADQECIDAVAPGSVGVVAALGAGRESGSKGESVLLDLYGDIAVVRTTGSPAGDGESAASRVLVLVRVAEKWLVRDVYDAADQPE